LFERGKYLGIWNIIDACWVIGSASYAIKAYALFVQNEHIKQIPYLTSMNKESSYDDPIAFISNA